VVENHNPKPQLKFRKNGDYFSSSEPAKLKISNLDFGVTADDLLELFSDFGTLKSTSLIKDESGNFVWKKFLAYTNLYNKQRFLGLEPFCCKKRRKSPNQKLSWGIGNV
jgi:RNA recognition motif-containing protein